MYNVFSQGVSILNVFMPCLGRDGWCWGSQLEFSDRALTPGKPLGHEGVLPGTPFSSVHNSVNAPSDATLCIRTDDFLSQRRSRIIAVLTYCQSQASNQSPLTGSPGA